MSKIKRTLINFKKYLFLMEQLITRDFKRKYKRSVLGVVWSLLYPILMMSVMSIIFSQMFKFQQAGVNYLVYLMTGIIMFNYFSEASTTAMTSVVDNFSLISKVYIPKYIFPLSKCLFVGINFVLTLIPWFIIILLTKIGFGTYPATITLYYLELPYIFACLFVFTIGVGLVLSATSVLLRDIWYIYSIILTIWQYFTPIFYNISILPKQLQLLLKFNPLYQFLTTTRKIVLYGQGLTLINVLVITFSSLLMLIIGIVVFKKNQDKFIYYI